MYSQTSDRRCRSCSPFCCSCCCFSWTAADSEIPAFFFGCFRIAERNYHRNRFFSDPLHYTACIPINSISITSHYRYYIFCYIYFIGGVLAIRIPRFVGSLAASRPLQAHSELTNSNPLRRGTPLPSSPGQTPSAATTAGTVAGDWKRQGINPARKSREY